MGDKECLDYPLNKLEAQFLSYLDILLFPQVNTQKGSRPGMPGAESNLQSSISTFLNKTDTVTQRYNDAKLRRESMEVGSGNGASERLGRASSVARATSVSRQFEVSSTPFMRAGSVARGYEVTSLMFRNHFHSLTDLINDRVLLEIRSTARSLVSQRY